MDLQRELSAVEQMVREKTPPHVMPTIEASIHAVKESGLESRALQPGESITDFELPNATGVMVKSLELRTRGPLLSCSIEEAGVHFAISIFRLFRSGIQRLRIEASRLLRSLRKPLIIH
jgi:hypothetical protein